MFYSFFKCCHYENNYNDEIMCTQGDLIVKYFLDEKVPRRFKNVAQNLNKNF